MILRRISYHLHHQNWLALCLEMVIVVAGIFIGLQIDAWRSSQVDREVEHKYLERLLSDMEESILAQRERIDSTSVGIANIDFLASSLHSGDLDTEQVDRLGEGYDWIGTIAFPETNMSTIHELQATGKILLIQDLRIRNAIGRLERSYARSEFFANYNQEVVIAAMPELQKWAYVPASTDTGWGYSVELDLDAMRPYSRAANIVSNISSWTKFNSTKLAEHHAETMAFRDLLSTTLQRGN
jgi:hypothetical protein